ncbi:MAG: SpoIID/LytB domain-containing protein [Patescibacteria group bacterium]
MKIFLLSESRAFLSRATSLSLVLFASFLVLGGLFLLPYHAHAAAKNGFEALQVVAPKVGFTMAPGEETQVMVGFKNIGTKTWKSSGASFVSIYTYDPKYRVSDFRADDWVDYTQAALLRESSVTVGSVGNIYLTLKAPKSEGTYEETFQLAAEDTAWIPGGEFTLTIKVQGEEEAQEVQEEEEDSLADGEASPESNGLSATVLLRSTKSVSAKAGQEVKYKVGVKNTGTATWATREVVTSDLAIASTSSNETRHASWVSASKLIVNSAGIVKPGGVDFFSFTFTAPQSNGIHIVSYKIAVDGETIPDFEIDIPVTVTQGSDEIKDEPISVDEGEIQADRMIEEPTLRIGVMIVDDETDWQVEVSCDANWRLVDSEGGLLGQIKAGDMVRAFYKNQRYYFNRGKTVEQTHKYLRFVPDDKDAVCTVENFDRRETRGAAYAFNQFRDVLELRYNSANDRTWLVNELPIEEYLYGLGETSNSSHEEFKKALITVARTYALYHWERGTKHADEYFHMNSYADDQVYFGYGYEVVHPLIKESVEDTRGVTVNYDGRTALTPYFSRSDGRTRSWSEVWGGDVAWLKGVDAPCDKKRGYTLWGHGVGMGATEALCMANEGSDWEEILNYFYSGIELNQRWD